MKLNCDLGESFGHYSLGQDLDVIPNIHMANVACGFHAGDANIMAQTVAAAVQHNVIIGAHPSYPDLQGFGRRNMDVNPEEVCQMVIYQAGALQGFCHAAGTSLSYIKPHGALYNTMMVNDDLLGGVIKATAAFGPEMKLMVQATPNWQHHHKLADNYGVELLWEAFADRSYEDDGSLRNRRYNDALLTAEQILERVKTLCSTGTIISLTGKKLEFPIDALCVHGDSAAGARQIGQIRQLLDQQQ